jgi:hypothetical protein
MAERRAEQSRKGSHRAQAARVEYKGEERREQTKEKRQVRSRTERRMESQEQRTDW